MTARIPRLQDNPAVPTLPPSFPPVVFVHGNGDTAGLWLTTVWRFESNGWPRDRLHALDLPYPCARDDDTVPQPGRTSSDAHRAFVAAEVARVRTATGAARVALVANSRGGYAVRNFLAADGARQVSHAVLGGTPNHGVWTSATHRPGNEFNGAGPLLSRLNRPGPDGAEVVPGVAWLTLRSDGNDKYCQPHGHWLGEPQLATGATAESPALRGAVDTVLPGADHRETSFGPAAFAHTWAFLTGHPPGTRDIVPEAAPRLDGKVSGVGVDNRDGADPSNLPLAGARVTVWATDPRTGARRGGPVHARTVGEDGLWGPFTAEPAQPYEFEVAADGYATTHVYRAAFPRGSDLVHLRAQRLPRAEPDVLAHVSLSRPRGYFGHGRDQVELDGRHPPEVRPGVAGVSAAVVRVRDRAGRTVTARFNDERLAGLAWPLAEGHVVLLELHH